MAEDRWLSLSLSLSRSQPWRDWSPFCETANSSRRSSFIHADSPFPPFFFISPRHFPNRIPKWLHFEPPEIHWMVDVNFIPTFHLFVFNKIPAKSEVKKVCGKLFFIIRVEFFVWIFSFHLWKNSHKYTKFLLLKIWYAYPYIDMDYMQRNTFCM